jgi:hypothetical protein
MIMSTAEARCGLEFMNAQAKKIDPIAIAVKLTNEGLPQEIITRLIELCDHVKIIAGRVIYIGKIIVMKVWEFVQANPNLAIGIAVGAALGALSQLVPFIGSLIAPIITTLSTVLGAVVGHRMDKQEQGKKLESGVIGITADIISLAKEFFKLFSSILNALAEYFTTMMSN